MRKSYLGVVTRRGLERLVEETEHAARFLERSCYRAQRPSAALCWAALDAQDAEVIGVLVRLGLFRAALWRLESDAQDGGGLPPSDEPATLTPNF